MDIDVDRIMIDSLKRAENLIVAVRILSDDLRAIEDHLEAINKNTDRIAKALETISSATVGSETVGL